MNIKYYIISLLFVIIRPCVYAQETNCATVIKEAEELYKNGNYENVVQMLNTALSNCMLSKREKEDAYILLTQAYLEKNNYTEANKLIIKILNNDPNFKIKENLYQEDFYAYYNRIKIRPMLAVGLKGGLNTQFYSVKNVYSVLDSGDYAAAYKSKTGHQYGAFAEYWFYNQYSVMVDGMFAKTSYHRTIQSSDIHKTQIQYSELLKSFETSFYCKKYFLSKQFKPYMYIGGYFTHLREAAASVDLQYKLKDKITPDVDDYDLSKNNIDVIAMRNINRQGILMGGGISYKFKNLFLLADATYRLDVGEHLTNSNNRFNNNELLFKYYYIDNDINMSNIYVSLSVSYIFKYSIKSK